VSERPFPDLPDQRGLATPRQLRAHGWTRDAVRHLVATRGRRVMPGVVAGHRGPLDADTLLVAAWLWAGGNAVLTGCDALARHGLALPRDPLVTRFLVPGGARSRAFGRAVTVRSRRADRARTLGGIPVTSVARALTDAARYGEVASTAARALTLQALQQRLCTPDRVEAELLAAPRNGLAGVRAGVREFRSGAWSVPEATLGRLVRHDHLLPPMLATPRLPTAAGTLIGIPDGYFADAGVAVQVHSRAHHAGPGPDGRDLWARTVESDADFERHGIVVVSVTPSTLDEDPARFLTTLREVLAAHDGRPAPAVLADGEASGPSGPSGPPV